MAHVQKLSLSAEDRQWLLKESASPANQQRRIACWAILLLADGRSRKEVARECKVHPVTVARWIARLRRNGIVGLLGLKSLRGRRSKLTESHLQVLREAALTPPHQLGKSFSIWTLERLARYFSDQTGVSIRAHYLGHLLRRMGIRWSHGTDSIRPPGFRDVEVLWFTVVRSKRSRSTAAEKGSELLLAAVSLTSGRLTTLRVGRRSSASFARFIKQINHEYPKTKVLLVGQSESIQITKQLERFLQSINERVAVSLASMPSRPDERHFRTGEPQANFQFLSGSLDAVVAQLLRGVRQIEQLLRV